jgi:hypothetical protein
LDHRSQRDRFPERAHRAEAPGRTQRAPRRHWPSVQRNESRHHQVPRHRYNAGKGPRRSNRDPLLAVAYLRVSTEEQVSKQLSLPMQEGTIRAYAAQRGITLVRILIEAGVSGRSDENRPTLKEMLGFVLDKTSKISDDVPR